MSGVTSCWRDDPLEHDCICDEHRALLTVGKRYIEAARAALVHGCPCTNCGFHLAVEMRARRRLAS